LIITGDADVLRDEGEAYASTLRQAGVPVTAVRFEGRLFDPRGNAGTSWNSRTTSGNEEPPNVEVDVEKTAGRQGGTVSRQTSLRQGRVCRRAER
jgi:acetyl esterase/lipase